MTGRRTGGSEPLERIRDFKEFHPPLDLRETGPKQGARCMNCGVPFCQSGVKLRRACSPAARCTT